MEAFHQEQKIQLYHNQIHGDYVDTLSPAHRLSSRHVLSRPPQGTLPRRQTNRCDVSICRQNIYSTLPRPSRRGQTTPTPAIRPTLIQLMLSCPETRSLLKELEMFTKGTRVYQCIANELNAQGTISSEADRLKVLAEERLKSVHGCDRLWSCIEDITENLRLLKTAYPAVNRFRVASCNLKAAASQQQRFRLLETHVRRLLGRGNQVLADSLNVLCGSTKPIVWLEQLSNKLTAELEFVTSLLDKTKGRVNSTHACFSRLDEAGDWAADAMKFASQHSMDDCMSHEALELLVSGLKSFMQHKLFVDDAIFDEISKEARGLSNRKLADQCKSTRRQHLEAQKLLTTKVASLEARSTDSQVASYLSNLLVVEAAESHLPDDEVSQPATPDWFTPLSSRSAPATPALLPRRCRLPTHLSNKRRSQSLEDDMTGRPHSCVDHGKILNSINAPVPGEVLAEEILEHGDVFYECNDDLESVASTMVADNCDIGDTGSTTDTIDTCYTVVDRGDKFLDVTADIRIPIDECTSLNNNSLKILSPSLEPGDVRTYLPNERPVPVKRGQLQLDLSMQSSADSDLLSPELSELDVTTGSKVDEEDGDDNVAKQSLPGNEVKADSGSARQRHSKYQVSPVLSSKQKQTAMQKRRSFHGFTSLLTQPIMNFARGRKTAEENMKRLSIGSDVSEQMEVTESEGTTANTSVDQSHTCFHGRDGAQSLKSRRLNKTMSLVTTSTDSLPSLPEEGVLHGRGSDPGAGMPGNRKLWSPMPVNSHLINKRALPTTRSTSMADLRLTESEVKSRITLAHIMDELLQTERDYVISLSLVVNHYIPELKREDVPQALRGKRAIIFGNIEKIFEFHSNYFLEELSRCENEPYKISQCFLSHEAGFLMYALYNKNKPKSDQLMLEHGSKFFREQQLQIGDKMDLSSYLLKPVQRMGKYALILKQVLKECPETSADYQDLLAAEEMIRFCLQHGNDLLAMDALQECDVNLQEQGTLLLQEEFIVSKNRRKMVRHIFLFEQLLVLAKPKRLGAGRDQYVYKSSMKTSDIGLTENVGTSGMKFEIWFRKRSGDSWTMQAKTTSVKNRWVRVIEKLLWTQALKNRESRLTELSSMGVGNKPCLDLKESADNINDRFIPTLGKISSQDGGETLTMERRNKNEPLKKRPHSVISLAASSSSASSNGSTSSSTARRSFPWLDLKSDGSIAKSFEPITQGNNRSRKFYRSDTRIHRCDSGISSLSDGLSIISPSRTSQRTASKMVQL